MLRFGSMVATAALLLSADGSGVIRLRQPENERVEFPSSENLPVLPDMSPRRDQDQAAQQNPSETRSENRVKDTGKDKDKAKGKEQPLQPESRLQLVRYVSGEYARVVQPIPAGKKGLHIKVGEREIVVDINGGGRGKKRLRDRIHLEIGGVPTMTSTGQETAVDTNAGATVFLDFGRPLPDMTPDELKQYLSGVLDFSKQHSAAVQWVDTLPPDIQNAIRDKRPAVGMDREMVVAALGRPDRKVREKTPDGNEIEDWIYGKPPAKTVFVKFDGDKVIKVEQFPQ